MHDHIEHYRHLTVSRLTDAVYVLVSFRVIPELDGNKDRGGFHFALRVGINCTWRILPSQLPQMIAAPWGLPIQDMRSDWHPSPPIVAFRLRNHSQVRPGDRVLLERDIHGTARSLPGFTWSGW